MCNSLPVSSVVQLPTLPNQMTSHISSLTDSLGIPRTLLASDEEIFYAWRDLPREIGVIPPNLRDGLIARMCVAVSTGLFDSAVNYVWNASILNLRQRVRDFGLPVVSQMLHRKCEEDGLIQRTDNDLITLCLQLNLISEDGYFFLDQCRDIRNNFSAAHPTMGPINDREFITFVNRCVRYALSDETTPIGVDVVGFIQAVQTTRLTDDILEAWVSRLVATHDAQRQLLFTTLHGIYCDPASPEPARLNAVEICGRLRSTFTTAAESDLIDQHSTYLTIADTQRLNASRQFFERIGLVSLLNAPEKHSIISHAVQTLWNVHVGMNNFYNEPPFAQRLLTLSEQEAIPDTVQENFVYTVVGCYIGNGYGVCNAAVQYYSTMIRSFSPREISVLVALDQRDTTVARRIRSNNMCQNRFGDALRLVDRGSVPAASAPAYERLMRRYAS